MSEHDDLPQDGGDPGAFGGHEGEHEHDPVAEAFGRGHGKKKKKKKHHLPGADITSLNLTPMMDIMTILLVFLIQSFAVDPKAINVTLDMRPPESTAAVVMEPATKLTITADRILVEDKEVALLNEIKPDSNGGQIEIPAVRDALLTEADKARAIANLGGAPFDGRLLIIAHNKTPYHVMMAVLFSAGQAKYGEYKLVVMQKSGG